MAAVTETFAYAGDGAFFATVTYDDTTFIVASMQYTLNSGSGQIIWNDGTAVFNMLLGTHPLPIQGTKVIGVTDFLSFNWSST